MNNDKISCSIIRVDLKEPVRNIDGTPQFDSRSYKVRNEECERVIYAINNYLSNINYPYIRAYLSGGQIVNQSEILTESTVIRMLSNEPLVKKVIEENQNTETHKK